MRRRISRFFAGFLRRGGGRFSKKSYSSAGFYGMIAESAAPEGGRRLGRRKEGTDMPKRWILGPVWLAVLLLALSGCFFRSPEDLYRSPERSADYLSLTQTIQAVKNSLPKEIRIPEKSKPATALRKVWDFRRTSNTASIIG